MEPVGVDIKADFGAFTKPHSTTGGLLTFKIPPKTAVKGIIGAIAGLSFEETCEYLKGLRIGIKPLSKISTKSLVYNSHYGSRKGRWVNIRQEILINPEYRIYLDFTDIEDNNTFKDDIQGIIGSNGLDYRLTSAQEGLRVLLENNLNYYTPYMGRNNFPLEYDTFQPQLEELDNYENRLECSCMIPREAVSELDVTELSQEVEDELSLNLDEPNSMKFYLINGYPVSQQSSRDYSKFRNMMLKEYGTDIRLKILPKKTNGEIKLFKDKNEELVPVF